MKTIRFDLSQEGKPFKLLNATNGGPIYKRHVNDQYISNFAQYKAARIPYSRNHDSAACGVYGGPYSHDITCIFPNFDADPCDPASYDFACTDEAILACLDAGTKTFFRLGQTIEHQIKKHGTVPPKDFKKWAVICEHIIRHYIEGWGDGLKLDMPYWEIWNEPDLDPDESTNKRCWGGTKAQFFDFYEIAAKHLKQCFPQLKIGGPALAWDEKWAEDFLREMKLRQAPVDFFSWHIYAFDPKDMVKKSERVRAMMDQYGYEGIESILNEWNYVKGWTDDFVYSLEAIHGLKGSSFMMSCICEAQMCDGIDMLMYYDTRPSSFNGAFDNRTAKTLKGYYPLYWYGMFYDLEHDVAAVQPQEDLYTLCGVDKEGKTLTVVTYYNDDDQQGNCTVNLDFGRAGNYEIYLLDETHDGELVKTTDQLTFEMTLHSTILIKEI